MPSVKDVRRHPMYHLNRARIRIKRLISIRHLRQAGDLRIMRGLVVLTQVRFEPSNSRFGYLTMPTGELRKNGYIPINRTGVRSNHFRYKIIEPGLMQNQRTVSAQRLIIVFDRSINRGNRRDRAAALVRRFAVRSRCRPAKSALPF